MKLKVIPPISPYHKRPACEHTLTKPLRNGTYLCTSRAAYVLDDVHLCERHTGRELLLHHLKLIGIHRLQGDKLG